MPGLSSYKVEIEISLLQFQVLVVPSSISDIIHHI
jgi:hypothetical protein